MRDPYDFIIIGAGVVGCAIARELTRYDTKVLLLERECDVAMGTSGRNSGVVHAGFYVPHGTLKAELNVRGHSMFPKLCRELDVPYKIVGKLVIARDDDEIPYLENLKDQGESNGVESLKLIDKERIMDMEPNINAVSALYSPASAIVDPFQLTIGLAESALKNGAMIRLNTKVVDIKDNEGVFTVETSNASFSSEYVINSAGLCSDKIAGMVGVDRYRIYPCRGQYHVLDKRVGDLVNGLVYPVPPKGSGGLGVHITPTIDGNIMLGPSADYIEDICDTSNTSSVMEQLYEEAKAMLPKLNRGDFIRSFSGIRSKLVAGGSRKVADFVIEEDGEVHRFINLMGIESPGLTAAPAIAEKVVDIIKEGRGLEENKEFDPRRKGPVRPNELSPEERARLIERNPDYGRIICRCELISRGEILDALNNPLGVRSVNGVKVRSRASMGRCQGSFCLPKIVEIMEENCHMGVSDIQLCGRGSELFVGHTKDLRGKEIGGKS